MLRLSLSICLAITTAADGDSSQGVILVAVTASAACLIALVAIVGVVAIIVNVNLTCLKVYGTCMNAMYF